MEKRLYQKLIEYKEGNVYPFHMPGHKRNPQLLECGFPYEMDITEIDGFDNLHHPVDILLEAQERMARLYQVKKSFYSINGSTAAILSAISATVPKGGKILIARNCHKAVYHGICLRDLQPLYVFPEILNSAIGLNGEIAPTKVRKILEEHPDVQAVLITSPTYDGIVSDVRTIAEIVHKNNIPLIVDEAHGAHFPFSDRFPESAITAGADLVIHSLHKTLPSPTQTAVLHVCSDRTDIERLRLFMGIYQTSSPSYVLMAAMDACVSLLEENAAGLFHKYCADLNWLRSELRQCRNIQLIEPEIGRDIYDYDPSKLILSLQHTPLNGPRLHQLLREKYHLEMEMEAEGYVLALTSVGDTKEGFQRLATAIREIDAEFQHPESMPKGNKIPKQDGNTKKRKEQPIYQKMKPADAIEAGTTSVPLAECIGKTSAEFAYIYPPGIPLIVPGEVITGQIVQNMRKCTEAGLALQGLKDASSRTIRVVKEEQ
ncbi:MAG: aminotransferase class I/II-fold pyridoxal phosphate-dependent enzyme [Blautia sp.]|nr:aminotransferase class I/II-fold pyridoxal phosphate-dependent enzyme [Blautia sp.]